MKTSKWIVSEFGWHNIQGVYCVMQHNILTNKNAILYIGSSKDIGNRLKAKEHPYQNLSKKLSFVFIKYKEVSDINDMLKLEYSLINKLRPVFNRKFYSYGR